MAAKTGRVQAIDFWRGLVLIAILCDHIPGNLIDKITPRNFGFSDSAEAFVFLSGFSVALAYYRKAADWRGVAQRCLSRAAHLRRPYRGDCGRPRRLRRRLRGLRSAGSDRGSWPRLRLPFALARGRRRRAAHP